MAERRMPRGLLDPESEAIAEAYEARPAVRRQLRGLLDVVQRAFSLEPQEQTAGDTALDIAGGFVPGVSQAMALRDIERARRAGDPAGMAMAATEFVPFGRLAGMMRGPGPIMSELDVYHGTPHRFPATEANPLGEFDASKIGTGEGAQAYGHGIYLAESPDVGKQYQQFLSSRKNDLLDPGNLAASMMYRTPEGTKEAGLREIDAALKGIKNFPSAYPDAKEQRAALERARELLETGAELPQQGGTLYKADLPDEMIDRMLDWDKPLSEQPKVLRALLNSDDEWKAYTAQLSPKSRKLAEDMAVGAKPNTGDEAFKLFKQLDADNPNADHNAIYDVIRKYNPRTTDQDWIMSMMSGSAAPGAGIRGGGGADLYNTLGGGEQAAQRLRAAGIPGMQYLDAGSRGQGGSGTRNFVVFPGEEKKVKILKRE